MVHSRYTFLWIKSKKMNNRPIGVQDAGRGNEPSPADVSPVWEGPPEGRVPLLRVGAVDISPAFN